MLVGQYPPVNLDSYGRRTSGWQVLQLRVGP